MALGNRTGIKDGRMNHLIHRAGLDRAEASPKRLCTRSVLTTTMYMKESLFSNAHHDG